MAFLPACFGKCVRKNKSNSELEIKKGPTGRWQHRKVTKYFHCTLLKIIMRLLLGCIMYSSNVGSLQLFIYACQFHNKILTCTCSVQVYTCQISMLWICCGQLVIDMLWTVCYWYVTDSLLLICHGQLVIDMSRTACLSCYWYVVDSLLLICCGQLVIDMSRTACYWYVADSLLLICCGQLVIDMSRTACYWYVADSFILI